MLNNTTKCSCGGRKRKTLHFCAPCWDALSTPRKDRINNILDLLKNELTRSERELQASAK